MKACSTASGASKGFVAQAQEAAALGSRLTDQLLTFARRRHLDPQILRLNDLVIGVTDLLRRMNGEHIYLPRPSPVISGRREPIKANSRARW